MPSGAFTVARGRINALTQRVRDNDPANSQIIVVALSAAEADATLKTRRTLAEVFAEAGNVEATNDGYARLPADGFTLSVLVDDGANRAHSQFYGTAWGAVAAGDRWVKAIICYDPDTTASDDANMIPLTYHDFFRNPRGEPSLPVTLGGTRVLKGDLRGFYGAFKE